MTTSIGQLEGFARLILNARKDDDPSRRSDANPQSLDHAVGELIEALRSGVFTSSEAAMSSSCDSNETTAEVLSEALQLAMQDDALISRYELTDALAHALRLAKISPSTRAELQTPSFAPFASLLVHATDRCRLATLGTHADRLVRDISKLLLQLAACAAQIGQLRSGVEMISAIDGWTRDAAESVAKLCGALCNIAAGSTSDPSRASRLGQAAEDEGSSTSCATRATAPPPCLLSPETVVLTATALPPFYTAGYTRLSRSRGSFTNRLHAHESDTGAKGVTGPLSSFIPPPGDLSASSRRKRRQGENTRGASPDAGRTARAPQVEEMRRQVLRLVRELAHHHSRALTGAWHLFLPESTSAAFIAGASSSSSWRSPTMSSPSSLLDLVAGELDLAPRPSLRLRLEACHALRSLISPAARGFLSLAQEERHSSLQRFPQRQQPRQRAFTSLSARVGSLLRATHVQLSRMLRTERARMGTDLRLLGELLQMAKQLAELTPWRRMGADLSAELLGALSVLITGSGSKDTPSQSQPPCDELVHACAALPCLEATLLAVTPAGTPTRETNAPRVDSRQAEGLVTKMCALLRQFTETNSGKAMQTRSRCWRVLALLMSICDRTHVTAEALPLVERRRQVDDDEHTSVLRFLAAARRRGVQVHISTIVDLAQDSLCRVSRRADCKRAACDALSTLDLHALQEEDQEPSRSALELLLRTLGNAHEDLQVRAAACQAVGTLVREQTLVMAPVHIVDALLPHCIAQDDTVLTSSASWAFANACEAFAQAPSASRDLGRWLRVATDLARELSSTKAQVSGVRALGALLRISECPSEAICSAVEGGVDALCSALASGRERDAKVAWNAAAAMASAFTSPPQSAEEVVAGSSRFLESLLESLASSQNFKVRIQVVTALGKAAAMPSMRSEHDLICEALAAAATRAQRDRDEAPSKELAHADALVTQLDELTLTLK